MRDIYAFLAKKALRRKPMVQAVWSAGACSRFPKRRQAAALQNEPVLPISCSPFHQKRMLFALPCH